MTELGLNVNSSTPPRVRWSDQSMSNQTKIHATNPVPEPKSRKMMEKVELQSHRVRAENPEKLVRRPNVLTRPVICSWCHPAVGGIVMCHISGGPHTVAASYPGCFVRVRIRSAEAGPDPPVTGKTYCRGRTKREIVTDSSSGSHGRSRHCSDKVTHAVQIIS